MLMMHPAIHPSNVIDGGAADPAAARPRANASSASEHHTLTLAGVAGVLARRVTHSLSLARLAGL